jgi:hypothetical protein
MSLMPHPVSGVPSLNIQARTPLATFDETLRSQVSLREA